MPADEARPPGIEMCSATTESETALSSVDVAKPADEAWLPGIAKCSATTESERAVSPSSHHEEEQWVDGMFAQIIEATTEMD